MYLMLVKKLCGHRRKMVDDLTVSHIHLCNSIHIFFCKFKIPDIDIFLNALLMDGFRDYDHATLYIPAKNNLSGCFSIFLCNTGKSFICKNILLDGETMLLMTELGFWESMVKEKMPNTKFLLQNEMDVNIPILDKEANVAFYCVISREEEQKYKKLMMEIALNLP